MIRNIKILLINVLFLTSLLVFTRCSKQTTGEIGYLKGTISIGPLCPVEKDPPDPSCLPTAETFKAYPVGIWTADSKHKIADVSPDLDGSYRNELAPGRYKIILEIGLNSISQSNLPVVVLIVSQQETLLNINVDTGIR
jgi:hypothetical protein